MGDAVILLHTAIAIVIAIVLITWARLNPVISLIIGSMYLGIAGGLGFTGTVETIGTGFGNLMTAIGLPIGFGVMLGSLLAAAGGIQKIAETALQLVSREKSPYAVGATGLVVSTPVFYDVNFVILSPLIQTIAIRTGVALAALGGAMALGAGTATLFLPPTPGPIAVAGLLEVPLGVMFLYSAVVAIPTVIVSQLIYNQLVARGLWNEETDEEEFKEVRRRGEVETEDKEGQRKELPSLTASLFPIALPLLLIVAGTVTTALGLEIGIIAFLGNRITALMLGLLAAYWLASRHLEREGLDGAVSEGLRASGLILLITGAGGSLGAVLEQAGTGEVLAQQFSADAFSPILLVWFVAALLRIAQGSGTVAIITAAGLVAPALGSIDVSAPLVALAAFSGSLFGGHVNDSGFWVTTKLLGLSTVGGFKVYTVPQAIAAVVSLPLVLIISLVL